MYRGTEVFLKQYIRNRTTHKINLNTERSVILSITFDEEPVVKQVNYL